MQAERGFLALALPPPSLPSGGPAPFPSPGGRWGAEKCVAWSCDTTSQRGKGGVCASAGRRGGCSGTRQLLSMLCLDSAEGLGL